MESKGKARHSRATRQANADTFDDSLTRFQFWASVVIGVALFWLMPWALWVLQ